MNNLEARVYRLEQDVNKLRQQMDDVLRRLAKLEQQGWANGGGGMGGGGSSGDYFDCVLGSTLNAASSVTGQTVQQRTGSSRITVSANATIYNDGTSSITSGKTAILAPNPDGSYTAIGVYC